MGSLRQEQTEAVLVGLGVVIGILLAAGALGFALAEVLNWVRPAIA